MRRVLVVILVLSLIAPAVSAQPDVDKIHMVSGESYTLTYDLQDGEEIQNIVVSDSVSRQSVNRGNGTISITVSAKNVDSRQRGSIFLQSSQQERRTDVVVFPKTSNGGNNDQVSDAQKKAQKWENLSNQWVNQRINRKQTSDGTLVVYEQRDPTKGPIDPATGIPEGKWVQVPLDENGDPEWIFDSPRGALVYSVQEAKTRRNQRTMILGSAFGIVAVGGIGMFVVLPRMRRKSYEKFLFGD
jgi:hypothetical protein